MKSEHVFTVDSETLKVYAELQLVGNTFDVIPGRFKAPRPVVTRDKADKCAIHVKVEGRAWTVLKDLPWPMSLLSPAGVDDYIDYDFETVLYTDKKKGRITGSHDGYPSYRVRVQKKVIHDFEELDIKLLAPPKDQSVSKPFTY